MHSETWNKQYWELFSLVDYWRHLQDWDLIYYISIVFFTDHWSLMQLCVKWKHSLILRGGGGNIHCITISSLPVSLCLPFYGICECWSIIADWELREEWASSFCPSPPHGASCLQGVSILVSLSVMLDFKVKALVSDERPVVLQNLLELCG